MSLQLEQQPLPLQEDADGVVRVGGTRVTLDTLIAAFRNGATAEEIVQQYPTLSLSDVYSVIGFYLRSPEKIDEYLKTRQEQAGRVRTQNQAKHPSDNLRSRLLARRR